MKSIFGDCWWRLHDRIDHHHDEIDAHEVRDDHEFDHDHDHHDDGADDPDDRLSSWVLYVKVVFWLIVFSFRIVAEWEDWSSIHCTHLLGSSLLGWLISFSFV